MIGRRRLAFVAVCVLAVASILFLRSGRPTAEKLLSNVIRHASLPIAGPSSRSTKDFRTVWFTDFSGNRIVAVDRAGNVVWEQHFSLPSIPDSGQPSNVEFMTIAPNGDIMASIANGMLIQEINRTTHNVVWHYGILNHQYCDTCLHQPKKAYVFGGHDVLVTDANNRRVVVIDQQTNAITWQYGHTAEMGTATGYLDGNRFAMPIDNNAHVLITDTLQNKIMVVDYATKQILWSWTKPDAKWLQNAYPAPDGGFIAEDHLKADVFKVSKEGQIVWDIHTLADNSQLSYPTDAIPLDNGNILIAEAGKERIIEVNPNTRAIVWQYGKNTPAPGASTGLPTSLAVEY